MTTPNEEYDCRHCGTPIYRTCAGQVRRQDDGSHHGEGGDNCVKMLKQQRDEARSARMTVYAIAVDLAHALRLAVTTEFHEERLAAIEKWERHVLEWATAARPCVSTKNPGTRPEGEKP
jgi:hypothetical protein